MKSIFNLSPKRKKLTYFYLLPSFCVSDVDQLREKWRRKTRKRRKRRKVERGGAEAGGSGGEEEEEEKCIPRPSREQP